jgi:hypothetical protein
LILVCVAGCASTVPLTVFQPRDTASVKSFFHAGAAIGAVYGDSVFALVQMEPFYLQQEGKDYARLWLLIQNRSSRPMLVEPLKCAVLRIESTGDASNWTPVSFTPSSPTKILATISNAQAVSQILSGIGATLEAVAAQPTSATTTSSTDLRWSETTTFNDKAEKQRAIHDRESARASAANDWYESFKGSVNQGILRRNTLFAGDGVNGYIYFQVPFHQPDATVRRYVVTLELPGGEQVATFDPIEGE